MSNFTIGASLQTGQKQTPSNANASSLPSSVSSSVPSSAASSSTLFTSSSSVTVLTHSSTSPTPAAITSSITTLPTSSSSPSDSPTILTSTSNVSNWTSSTPYNFPMENATLKVDKGFPAGGIAGRRFINILTRVGFNKLVLSSYFHALLDSSTVLLKLWAAARYRAAEVWLPAPRTDTQNCTLYNT